MRKPALLVSAVAAVLVTSVATSWAASFFVDPRNGAGATCTVTAPCDTLDKALALAGSGDTINILSPGNFGPICLDANIAITGPSDNATITFSATAPGVMSGGSHPNCPGTATVAVQIAAGTGGTVKLKNLILNNGGGTNGAVKVDSAFNVSMTNTVLRGGSGAISQMMTVASSQGSQLQLFFNHCDIAFSGSGGGIAIAPSGATPMRVHFANSEVHNAVFGLQVNATGLTGSADIAVAIDSTEFFSFNNSSVSVTATGANQARVSVARSTVLNTGGAALKFNGGNAFGALYENVITGNSSGVNVIGGASVATFQNNQIFGNGNNCAVNGAPTACTSALISQAQN